VFIAADKYVEFVSSSMPYTRFCDINQTRLIADQLNDLFPDDEIVFDAGYVGKT
jgi:hypothetical protein